MAILLIFTNFTFTLKVFFISKIFQLNSLKNIPRIKPQYFIKNPFNNLKALYAKLI
jgi:hypothetical protein